MTYIPGVALVTVLVMDMSEYTHGVPGVYVVGILDFAIFVGVAYVTNNFLKNLRGK